MDPADAIDAERLRAGRGDWLDAEALSTLAQHPLDCIDREFPHFVYSMDAIDDIEPPTSRHPIFYGCFDWHSAVHSHWCLVRQLRLFDDHPRETDIAGGLTGRFTPEAVEREVTYFDENETFERPYGWGWFLRFAAELALWPDERGATWRETLQPLESRIVDLVEDDLLTQDRPFRVGTHGNSAFALACVLDYARVTANGDLAESVAETARAFYLDDRDYPVEYEPLGWDTVSPALVEADLMRRVLDPERFAGWLDGFLPAVTSPSEGGILDPVTVESADGVAFHLVGLNLSRAWCLAGIADGLEGHRDVQPLEREALRHATQGLDGAFTDDYAGTHWLPSFVVYLLTRNAGAIAPD